MDDDTAEAIMITLASTTERDLSALDRFEPDFIWQQVDKCESAERASMAGL